MEPPLTIISKGGGQRARRGEGRGSGDAAFRRNWGRRGWRRRAALRCGKEVVAASAAPQGVAAAGKWWRPLAARAVPVFPGRETARGRGGCSRGENACRTCSRRGKGWAALSERSGKGRQLGSPPATENKQEWRKVERRERATAGQKTSPAGRKRPEHVEKRRRVGRLLETRGKTRKGQKAVKRKEGSIYRRGTEGQAEKTVGKGKRGLHDSEGVRNLKEINRINFPI